MKGVVRYEMHIANRPVTSTSLPLVELVVDERLDQFAVPRLTELLEEALALQPERLVVDLSVCPTIDAAGIGLLLSTHRQARLVGTKLTLHSPSPRLRRNLELARADRVLDISSASTPPADQAGKP